MKRHPYLIPDGPPLLFLAAFGGWLCFSSACAQGLYNESALYINGAGLYIDGEVQNSGILVNEGHLAFSKGWDSEGTYTGWGTLEANGHVPQKIVHHGQNVYSFIANGWGTKYVTGKITITGEFHLIEGIVHISSVGDLTLTAESEVYGGSVNSYVEGPLTAEGTGYRFFPVGKNGSYAPIELMNVKGKSPVYSIEAFEDAPLIAPDNTIVRNAMYWERRDLAGEFRGSAISVSYNPTDFRYPDRIIMLAGSDFDSPFVAITELRHSVDSSKVTTNLKIAAPLILLGEISENWKEADFYLPTALSPNAVNADNRSVKVFGERLAEDAFHFAVFNRWGMLVYESVSLDDMATNGWDGRSMNGDALGTGAYPYRLTAVDKTGRRLEKKGVITIIY